MITVVDLPKYLLGVSKEKGPKDLFIVTNFNKMNIAFRVHTVVGISRISAGISKNLTRRYPAAERALPQELPSAGKIWSRFWTLKKLWRRSRPETTIQMSEIDQLGPRNRSNSAIVVAEDSILLSKMIEEALHKSGYVNTKMFSNGQELWDYLNTLRGNDRLDELVSLIITDIEMPQMDGHRLTKLVKSDKEFQHIPLVIFSSLITEEMRRKGKELGRMSR